MNMGETMNIWIDDIRIASDDFVWCYSVNSAIRCISKALQDGEELGVIAIDHDAGDYFNDGGDFYKVLDWLEEHEVRDLKFKLLTQNGVGREKLQFIIQHNADRLNWAIV